MEHLNRKEKEFVALGAALACNCIPCVINHIREARKSGITDDQIRAAVELAAAVRKMPAVQVVAAAHAQLGDSPGLSDAKSSSDTPSCCG